MSRRLCLAALIASFLLAPAVFAQATRTWVSGVGDDANPCSRTAPCKTFAGAISKTAVGGEIDVLDPGGFGAVTITKSITIDGGPFAGGVLAGGVSGIVINSTAANSTIILRNLSIVGVTNAVDGVVVFAADTVSIQNCNINGFQRGINFHPTQNPSRLLVTDSRIFNNDPTNVVGGGGILVKPTSGNPANIAITNCRLDHNNFGLRVESGAKVIVADTTASNNTNAGFVAVSSGVGAVDESLVRCQSSNNSIGVKSDGTGGSLVFVRLSETQVTANATGLSEAAGGHIASQQTNWVQGNATNGVFTDTILSQ
jgi:hypothetical protein